MQFRTALALTGLLLTRQALAGSELASMELEQLMDMNVTTVAKREQALGETAAAVYTITQEDIRRSGATSLPEVLAQAPGVEVARLNASLWSISARGFNSQFATKLLVLIDGRSIYTPLFGGVYWDSYMPPLDDIQRIEVIRGPGASLWGANAVNGVINIITYDSEQTRSTRVAAGIGNEERGFVRWRQGFGSDTLTGRVNAQYRKVDESVLAEGGEPADDNFSGRQFGARLDWQPNPAEKATLDASWLRLDRQLSVFIPESLLPLVSPREDNSGHQGHVLARWLHQRDNGDAVSLQAYMDEVHRFDPVSETWQRTTDVEFQYNHETFAGHRLTWGLNQRRTRDELKSSFIIYTDDTEVTRSLHTGFVQDEISLASDINLTLGVKVEKSAFIGTEEQPSVRIAWFPDDRSTWWAAVSRATRAPSRLETSMEYRTTQADLATLMGKYFPGLSGYTVIKGDPDFDSEKLQAFEAGWRWQARDNLHLDISTFLNDYDKLLTYVVLPPAEQIDYRYVSQGYIGLAGSTDNVSSGRARGLETALEFRPSERWTIKSSYTYFNFDSGNNPPRRSSAQGFELQSPEHRFHLSSYHTLPRQWELYWAVHYIDPILLNKVPTQVDMHLRAGKQLTQHLSVSVMVKNLFDAAHTEFFDYNYGPYLSELQRSAFVQVDWR